MRTSLDNLEDFLSALKARTLCSIESLHLNLEGSDLSLDRVKALASGLTSGHCPNGMWLDLGNNNLGPEGAKVLATALASGCCPAGLSLNLWSNNFGPSGAKAFATALTSGHCPTRLSLDLGKNNFGPKGAEALASALISGHCPPGLSLNLVENNFGLEGAKAFASAFASATCPDLQLSFISTMRGSDKKEASAYLLGKYPALSLETASIVISSSADPTRPAAGGGGTGRGAAAVAAAGTVIDTTAVIPFDPVLFANFRKHLAAQLAECVKHDEVSEATRVNEAARLRRLEEEYISANPKLKSYRDTLYTTLFYTYQAATVLRSGLVENKKTTIQKENVDYAVTTIQFLAKSLEFTTDSIPGLSHAAKALVAVIKKSIDLINENRIKLFLDIVTAEEYASLLRRVANTFSLAFEKKILSLDPKVMNRFFAWFKDCKDRLIINDLDTAEKALAYQQANLWISFAMLSNKDFKAGLGSDEWILLFNPEYNLAELAAKRIAFQRAASTALPASPLPAAGGAGISPRGASPVASTDSSSETVAHTSSEVEEKLRRELIRLNAQVKTLEQRIRKMSGESSTRDAGGGLAYASAFSSDTKDGKEALAELSRLRTAYQELQHRGINVDEALALLGRIAHEHGEIHASAREKKEFLAELFGFGNCLNVILMLADECYGKGKHSLVRSAGFFSSGGIDLTKELQKPATSVPKSIRGEVVRNVLKEQRLKHRISITDLRISLREGRIIRAGLSRPKIEGLIYQEVPGDGHCLFHAVGLYVGAHQAYLRNVIAIYIELNLAEFCEIIKAVNPDSTAKEYLKALRSGEQWADNFEIAILMSLLGRPIVIIGPDGKIRNRSDLAGATKEPIFVYYNGRNHYDACLLEDGWGKRAKEILASLLAAAGTAPALTAGAAAAFFRSTATTSTTKTASDRESRAALFRAVAVATVVVTTVPPVGMADEASRAALFSRGIN